MAAASGITASTELLSTWSDALQQDSKIRLIKVVIENEVLVASTTKDEQEQSFEKDFALLDQQVEPDQPCYLLYRLENNTSWLFISYVPDTSPVRQKMLYASTRQSLLKSLGSDSRISLSIFVSTKDELSYTSYQSHLQSSTSEAPLTAREQEIQDIKDAEARERRDGTGGSNTIPRSMLDLASDSTGGEGRAGTGWSDEAIEFVKSFGEGEKDVVQLQIDNERIISSTEQPTSLNLPKDQPCYVFFKHSLGTIFIYSCPSSSPIKSRMIYASSFHSVKNKAQSLNIDISKRIETSTPEEINDSYIEAEFGTKTDGSSENAVAGGGGDKPAFARPSRPGRKR